MFSPMTEFWRSYFDNAAGDLPVDFILDWIERESGGNPCSTTSYQETGTLQLMPPHDIAAAGTTVDALRTMCVPGTSNLSKSLDELTPDEINEQVRSSVQYVNAMRAQAHQLLNQVGADWSESSADFWSLVKLQHTLPSLNQYLQVSAQKLGRAPASWDEFAQAVPMDPDYPSCWDQTPADQRTRICGNAHWMQVSSDIGEFGAGFFGGKSKWWITAIGLIGVGVGIWWYNRRAHRRIGQGV